MQNMDTDPTKLKSSRRVYVRCFVAVALIVIAIDTAPSTKLTAPLQQPLRLALNVIGLWQGEWPLFAPNPTINNGWLSAEFYAEGSSSPILAADGQPLSWHSPIWSECTAWNKFYRFRHMNYFNRAAYRGKDVIEDLSDFVARKKLGPEYHFVETQSNGNVVQENPSCTALRLGKNGLKIVLPEDGTFPSPEETTWVYIGSGLGIRKYAK